MEPNVRACDDDPTSGYLGPLTRQRDRMGEIRSLRTDSTGMAGGVPSPWGLGIFCAIGDDQSNS